MGLNKEEYLSLEISPGHFVCMHKEEYKLMQEWGKKMDAKLRLGKGFIIKNDKDKTPNKFQQ